MKFQRSFAKKFVLFCAMTGIFAAAATAQVTTRPMPVAVGNNLYCAGYIQSSAISTENKIIGSRDEADKYNYSQNDFMYINMGSNKGVSPGDVFAVVRPRAKVKSAWSHKGNLGFYVQEVGALEVVRVKSEVSVARVKWSCDNFLLGDLVQLSEKRTSPMYEQRGTLDEFADPTGKATGRIVMARDLAEVLSRDFIVYVDLGADDNVHVGDHLTIFRKLGKGNVFDLPQHEDVSARDYGFDSWAYHGGKISNQAPRKSGGHAGGKEVTTYMAKEGRPSGLRKIVGEAVVLNVKEKTATVVITRTASEIHTGDQVEIQ